MNWIDWIGYLAATLVVISFLASTNIRTIRLINIVGAITFVMYGVMLDVNLPVVIPNAFIAVIQGYYLFLKN
jgi:hypothetical protein